MPRQASNKIRSMSARKPTRRSRRLSGLPPLDDELSKDIKVITNRRKRRNIKTPKKRSIIIANSPFKHNITTTDNDKISSTQSDGEIDYESDGHQNDQIEGALCESKPILNITETVSIDHAYGINIDKDSSQYNYQADDESSSNDYHDEEEKSTLLLSDDTPKDVSKIKDASTADDLIHYPSLVSFCCVFVLHFASWLSISNIKSYPSGSILFISSFLVYTFCRFYHDKRLDGIHSIFVLVNVMDCLLSVFFGMNGDYKLYFKSNEWITFGLLASHFVYDVRDIYYDVSSEDAWLICGQDAMIILFLILFLCIGDNAIDLIFVYAIKCVICMAIGRNYAVIKHIQINTIAIHFAAWFSIKKIFASYSTE
eukprot:127820_1